MESNANAEHAGKSKSAADGSRRQNDFAMDY
jgi:hypothetical protein